jgi:Amt family ammonium transporter
LVLISNQSTHLPIFYLRETIMATEIWLPALLGYLIPIGVFLLAWGGMEPNRARRAAAVGALALSLATIGYFAVGFAFHLGGAQVVDNQPAYEELDALSAVGENKEWGLIGLTGFFLSGYNKNDGFVPLTPEALALFVNYLPMVATAVLLVTLSVHEQARGWQAAAGGLIIAAVLFPIIACWAWGGGWLTTIGQAISQMPNEPQHGFVDYAGSGVVYLLGGLASLGALVGLKKRLPPGKLDEPAEMPPAHFPLLANLGTMLFGLGLLSWSLSTPFHAAGATLNLPRIAANIVLAGAGATFVTQVYSWFAIGRANALMAARGTAAGFIAIAAGAPFIPQWWALFLGAAVGLLLPLGVHFVEHVLRLSDATATITLGLTAGLIGLLVVPVFADGLWGQGWNGVGPDEYRTETLMGVTGFLPAEKFDSSNGDGPGQLIAQLAGIGAIGVLSFFIGWLTFTLLNLPYTRPWEWWGK